MIATPPPPGSDEAVEHGCTCPRMDNGYGRGWAGRYWITEGCPLHSPTKEQEHD